MSSPIRISPGSVPSKFLGVGFLSHFASYIKSSFTATSVLKLSVESFNSHPKKVYPSLVGSFGMSLPSTSDNFPPLYVLNTLSFDVLSWNFASGAFNLNVTFTSGNQAYFLPSAEALTIEYR